MRCGVSGSGRGADRCRRHRRGGRAQRGPGSARRPASHPGAGAADAAPRLRHSAGRTRGVRAAEVAVDLGAITAPSLVVSGAKDLPDFRLIAARLTALLPGARPVELPWAGHLPTLDDRRNCPRDDRLLAGDRAGRVSHQVRSVWSRPAGSSGRPEIAGGRSGTAAPHPVDDHEQGARRSSPGLQSRGQPVEAPGLGLERKDFHAAMPRWLTRRAGHARRAPGSPSRFDGVITPPCLPGNRADHRPFPAGNC